MASTEAALERRAQARQRRRNKPRHKRSAPVGVCLECRTLLAVGERCDGGDHHRVASLAKRSGREQLLAAVWGPPKQRDRATQLMKVGGSGAGFYLLTKFWWYGLGATRAFVLVPFIALGAAALYWLVTLIVAKRRAKRERPAPRGAARTPEALVAATELRGRVKAADDDIVSPASKSYCRGYAVELCADSFEDSPVLLRHARCASLTIELDDGSRVELEAGRIRLAGPSKTRRASPATVRAIGENLNLPSPRPDALSLFPYDRVNEVLLADGDEVVIVGSFEREPLADGGNTPYREARWCYRPSSVPSLHIVSDAA